MQNGRGPCGCRYQGSELELLVPQQIYIYHEEGTLGLLVHQGEIFKRFIADPS